MFKGLVNLRHADEPRRYNVEPRSQKTWTMLARHTTYYVWDYILFHATKS